MRLSRLPAIVIAANALVMLAAFSGQSQTTAPIVLAAPVSTRAVEEATRIMPTPLPTPLPAPMAALRPLSATPR
jgi:hypothetical protein